MFTYEKNKVTKTIVMLALALSTGAGSTFVAHAKDGDVKYRGIVQSRPAGKIGTWVIGGRLFNAVRSTQLDTVEGPLNVGACAKVTIRAGAVKEIESEPARDCR